MAAIEYIIRIHGCVTAGLWLPFWWQCIGPMRMYSPLALIPCNATLWGRGWGERYLYEEKESGTVGSTVGEERGGRFEHYFA